MTPFEVNFQLSFKEFRNMNFKRIYSKWTMRFFTGFGLFLLLIWLVILPIKISNGDDIDFTALVMPIILLLLLPLMFYYQIRNAYFGNGQMSEKISYTFTNDSYTAKGESFETKMAWSKVQKVEENKNWFFIQNSPRVVNAIPKSAFDNSESLAFKHLIGQQSNIKNKLKQK